MSRVVIREVEFQYTEVRIVLSDEYYSQDIAGLDLQFELPRVMKRSISSSNVDLVGRLKKSIEDDKREAPTANATPYFDVFTAFSFVLPLSTLDKEKPAVREAILEGVIDKPLQRRLEVEEGLINWDRLCIHLSAIKTLGDGNCLMHAASLAMWGLHDRSLILRSIVYEALAGARNAGLFDRWQTDRRTELRQLDASMEVHQWQAEYQQLVDMVNPKNGTGRMESLTDFHIFVLSNILRRPIIVYGTVRVPSLSTGASFGPNNIPGVYLPLMWNHDSVSKDPITLGYVGSHFSALVPSDQQVGSLPPAVPLCNHNGQLLPIKFMLPTEVHYTETFMREYMTVSKTRSSAKPVLTALLNVKDQPNVISRLWVAHVEHCKKEEESPVPAPRRGSSNPHHAPSSDTAERSSKCLQCNSPGANADTHYLCRDCYQGQLKVLGGGSSSRHNPPPTHGGNHQPPGGNPDSLPSPMTTQLQLEQTPHQGGHLPNADLPRRQVVCKNPRCDLYGSAEKQGYCSQCYKDRNSGQHQGYDPRRQQPTCSQCHREEGVEQLGNICRTCHGQNMHYQPKVQSTQGSAVLQHTQREDPIGHNKEETLLGGAKVKKCTYADCGRSSDPASNGKLCSEHFFNALDGKLPGFSKSLLSQGGGGGSEGRKTAGHGGNRGGYSTHYDLPAPVTTQQPSGTSRGQGEDRRGQDLDRLDISGRMVDVSTQKCFVCMDVDPQDSPFGVFVCSRHAKEMHRTMILQRGNESSGHRPVAQQHSPRAGPRPEPHPVQPFVDRYVEDPLPDPPDRRGHHQYGRSSEDPYGSRGGGQNHHSSSSNYQQQNRDYDLPGSSSQGYNRSVDQPGYRSPVYSSQSGYPHQGSSQRFGDLSKSVSQDKLCATPGCSNLHQGKAKGVIYCDDCERARLANRSGRPVPLEEQCKEPTCSRRKGPTTVGYCEQCYEVRYLAPEDSY